MLCRVVMPTSSMSGVRMHFWMLVARFHGGGALAQEVGHELHHARVDEQQVGVVEDHRGAGHLGVARVHEVIEESLPDLVCLHVLLVLFVLGVVLLNPTALQYRAGLSRLN